MATAATHNLWFTITDQKPPCNNNQRLPEAYSVTTYIPFRRHQLAPPAPATTVQYRCHPQYKAVNTTSREPFELDISIANYQKGRCQRWTSNNESPTDESISNRPNTPRLTERYPDQTTI